MSFIRNAFYRLTQYKRTYEAFHKITPYLESGIYTIRARKVIKKAGFPIGVVLKSSVKSIRGINSVSFYFGEWSGKTVAFFGNKVISFYSEKWQKHVDYISKYFEQINYPKSAIYDVSREKRYTVAEKVEGEIYSDDDHIKRLSKDVIKYNSDAKMLATDSFPILKEFNIFNIPFYLQHGDFTLRNVIWISSDEYKVIDFDTIDFFPCLYDLLRLLVIDYGLLGLKLYIEGELDEELSDFMKKNNISDDVQVFKDKCLAAFILYTNGYWDTANVVKGHIPENYNYCNDVISSMKNTM